MKRTFQHKFKGGVTATMTVDDQFAPGSSHIRSIEWSATPKQNIIPEYMRWVHSVNEFMATKIGGRILHVFQLPGDRFESWAYEPNKPAKKI